ncbi:microtubule-associated protein Gb4, partial [Trypanosoma theileri]
MPSDTYIKAVDKSVENLRVGDFVAVATQRADGKKVHWTLGTVDSAPYMHDIEVRLWEKRRDEETMDDQQDAMETEEGREIVERIGRVKKELSESMQQAAELTEQLRERRRNIMIASNEAEKHVAQSRAAVQAASLDVDNISYRNWQELKSYRVPPKMVTTILRAVMLLLGEDGASTWPQMQRILRDVHFKSRIIDYDPGEMLTTERCEYILRECVRKRSFQYDRAVHGSQAMGPIYYWVLAQLDSCEAAREQHRVEKQMAVQKKELREVMKEINEQQQRMAEYQIMMEKADEQLLAYRERQRKTSGKASSVSSSNNYDAALERYKNSFAGAANKKYLLPAFYTWQPTDYCIVVVRRNALVGFGPVHEKKYTEGNELDEQQIRLLDIAIQRNQRNLNALSQNNEERARLLKQEEKEFEEGIFKKTKNDGEDDTALIRDLLQCQVDGENWKQVLDLKRAAVVDTFVEETAEALELPEKNITVLEVKCREQPAALVVDTEVLHDGLRSKEELRDTIDSFPYPKLHALYGITSANLMDHNMLFKGELWEQILQENKEEVERAFNRDTINALYLEDNDNISVKSTEYNNGLYVVYKVQTITKTENEITSAVDAYDYPEIWALYVSYQEKLPVILERVFTGEKWDEVLQKERPKLSNAFQKDSSKALDLPKTNVKVVSMTATEEQLAVKYTAQDERRGPEEVSNVLAKCPYSTLNEIYKNSTTDKSSWKETVHEAQFEGEDWDYTAELIEPKIKEAVAKETAAALQCAPEDVTDVQLLTTPKKLRAIVRVRHDPSLKETQINDIIRDHPYNGVWMLYKIRPFDESKKLETAHELDFEGEKWKSVVEKRRAEVEEAVVYETALALDCNREDVTGVELDPVPQALVAIVKIRHTPQFKRDRIKELLQQHEFTKLWELYEDRPAGDKTMETRHELGFEGTDWDYVVEQHPKEVEEAVASETARALEGEREDVTKVELAPAPHALIAFVTVQHSPQLGKEDIKTKLTAYPYNELWALYEERPHDSSELTKKFEGDDWDLVVENNREKLERAFRKETADALGVSP